SLNDVEDRQTARILRVIIFVLLGLYAIVGLNAIYLKEWRTVWVAGIALIIQIIPFWLIKPGKLGLGSFIITLSVLTTTTSFAITGEGMRDVAIVGFPIIFIFAGLTLNKVPFRFCVGLSIAVIAGLALGQNYGWFVPKPFPEKPDLPEFTILAAVIIIAAIAVELLARNIRKNLEQARQEIEQRKTTEEKLLASHAKETKLRQALENEAKSRIEFSRMLVHELKTPLTAVLVTSEILANELKEEPWSKMAQNVYRGGENLNKRIDELIDLSKGEIGMLKPNFARISPMNLIKEIVSEIEPLALKRKLTLTTELPASLPIIMADGGRIRQIIYNLITNAIKYSNQSGKIIVKAREETGNFIVEVEDNGPGLSAEDQAKIFQPYERLSAATRQMSGMGLGLALSKNLVELHHGKMWVKSQKGSGSTFGFSIPVDGTKDAPDSP
ncbi:MAG: HAMP domain-containing sensor histidine kinase, partial [Dehalococcoidales bacterium]|nr:HAMP domain-containing sensor histidine kinase [Dehalococcoidales bacterium]